MRYDQYTHAISVRPCANGFVVTHHQDTNCHGVEHIAADAAEVVGVVVKILTTANLREAKK